MGRRCVCLPRDHACWGASKRLATTSASGGGVQAGAAVAISLGDKQALRICGGEIAIIKLLAPSRGPSRLLERNYADLLALFPHDKQEVEVLLRPQTQRGRAEEDDGEG